jgi:hypothetical protein
VAPACQTRAAVSRFIDACHGLTTELIDWNLCVDQNSNDFHQPLRPRLHNHDQPRRRTHNGPWRPGQSVHPPLLPPRRRAVQGSPSQSPLLTLCRRWARLSSGGLAVTGLEPGNTAECIFPAHTRYPCSIDPRGSCSRHGLHEWDWIGRVWCSLAPTWPFLGLVRMQIKNFVLSGASQSSLVQASLSLSLSCSYVMSFRRAAGRNSDD